MERLELVLPNNDFEIAAMDYKKEHLDNLENELHGSALFDKIYVFDDWLALLKNNSDEKTVNPDWVVSTTYFAIRKYDSKIIGMIDIRHTLNELLENYGGHIGYGVRPSERNKGYATQMLKLALEYCVQINLKTVMLACYKGNVASRKTIEKCGGILGKEFLYTDGKIVQVFWITL